jgi:peptide deformylase
MIRAFNRKYSDYDDVQGISGPNIGIPLSIIAVKIRKKNGDFIDGLPEELSKNRRTKPILFMLNPKISVKSEKIYSTKSNCGSLMLKNPIKVYRHEHIEVVYWDLKGYMHLNGFDKPVAATIQHEVDHINGILITERRRRCA